MFRLVVILLLAAATSTVPARNSCLGGVCLDMPEQDLVSRYGPGRAFPPERPFERCYRSRAKSTFVKAIVDDDDPHRSVTAVLASVEPVCSDAGPARLGTDFTGCRGIRLFDDVDRLLGVGATRRTQAEKGSPWDGSPSDVSQFDYACELESACGLRASAFVRGRTIIAISIWRPDC